MARKTKKTTKRRKLPPAAPPPPRTVEFEPTVRLTDLPEHILRSVAEYAEKKYALMRTCKRTCLIAGQVLYSKELPHTHLGTKGILRGLEHHRSMRRVPFGPDLKRAFLRSARCLLYDMDLGGLLRQSLYTDTEIIRRMRQLNRSAVSMNASARAIALVRTRGWIAPGIPEGAIRSFLALSDFLRPQHLCWGGRIVHPEICRRQFTLEEYRHYPLLTSAGGATTPWSPEIFVHHSLDHKHQPLVCYGSLNVVYITHRDALDPASSKGAQAESLIIQLRRAHPELKAIGRATVADDELRRRDRTRWEFRFHTNAEYPMEDVLKFSAEKQAIVEEAIPEMKGRFTIELDVGERALCQACGNAG